jgi:hypothetical protein
MKCQLQTEIKNGPSRRLEPERESMFLSAAITDNHIERILEANFMSLREINN